MSIEITDKFKPKNNGTFTLMDAEDIAYKEGRLPDYLFVCLTQDEYDDLKSSNKLNDHTPYIII